jgi:AcrR family transcriptional regulator
MGSNKSRLTKDRIALAPQRRHGKWRVATLLESGAAVIAEKGFQAATMAEIASKAGAPIGSLYRFFPNKEILADALIQGFETVLAEAFGKIQGQIRTLSLAALTRALLSLMVDLQGEKAAIRALLETHPDWSAKREQFRHVVLRHIAQTLRLRGPKLSTKAAESMAVVLLYNMKAVSALNAKREDDAYAGALVELHEMTRFYLLHKLGRRARSGSGGKQSNRI